MSVHNLNAVETGVSNSIPTTGFLNTDPNALQNCTTTPLFSYPYQYHQDYNYPFRIRQIMNGWIVGTSKGEYAFKDAAEVGKFIAKELAELQPK